MHAAQNDQRDAVDLLVKHGANINVQDSSEGKTALMRAILQGHIGIVEDLASAQPDLTLKDHSGNTALDIAKKLDQFEIVAVLEALEAFQQANTPSRPSLPSPPASTPETSSLSTTSNQKEQHSNQSEADKHDNNKIKEYENIDKEDDINVEIATIHSMLEQVVERMQRDLAEAIDGSRLSVSFTKLESFRIETSGNIQYLSRKFRQEIAVMKEGHEKIIREIMSTVNNPDQKDIHLQRDEMATEIIHGLRQLRAEFDTLQSQFRDELHAKIAKLRRDADDDATKIIKGEEDTRQELAVKSTNYSNFEKKLSEKIIETEQLMRSRILRFSEEIKQEVEQCSNKLDVDVLECIRSESVEAVQDLRRELDDRIAGLEQRQCELMLELLELSDKREREKREKAKDTGEKIEQDDAELSIVESQKMSETLYECLRSIECEIQERMDALQGRLLEVLHQT